MLWKEIQALQIEQELDREFGHPGAGGGHHGGHPSGGGHHGHHNHPDRRMEREKRRLTERKLGRLIGGAQTSIYDDSDSSRGNIFKSLIQIFTIFEYFIKLVLLAQLWHCLQVHICKQLPSL